jgi:hypothetical protein
MAHTTISWLLMGLKGNFSLHMVKWYPIVSWSLCFNSLQFSQEFLAFADNEAPIKLVLRFLWTMNEKHPLDAYGHFALCGFKVDRESDRKLGTVSVLAGFGN